MLEVGCVKADSREQRKLLRIDDEWGPRGGSKEAVGKSIIMSWYKEFFKH